MIAAVTDQDVQHALALSDFGVVLLIAVAIFALILVFWRRPVEPPIGQDWAPEEPRVIAQRYVFDQDCPHLARTRGDGWRSDCRDCGADLGK